MNYFPNADPIPLPAPVWLFKLLSLLTLGLHFSAVMILVGSLCLVIYLNAKAHRKQDAAALKASHVLARQLPTVMTFVINLGVPPLLFLQVLYGRMIYSSSVLIGAFWISVIGLVMLAYWLIYRCVDAFEAKKKAWPYALASLLAVLFIGNIYSMNMTLMLHPEVWRAMYQKSPTGTQSYHDSMTGLRLGFVLCGGPLFGGLWASLLSNLKHVSQDVKVVLRKAGAIPALLGGVGMVVFGYLILSGQPADVQQTLSANMLAKVGSILCAVTALAAGALGLLQASRTQSTFIVSLLGTVAAFLAAATGGIVRDGIRDATLLTKGFDVNAGTVYPNWSVLIAFFLLFVVMLGIVIWLLSVVHKATPPQKEVAL